MKTEQTNAKKYTLADAILLGGSNRDITDDVYDCLNCFEYTQEPNDDYDRVLLWIANGVEVLWGDKEVICCKLSQFIENNRRIFDAFLNEVYREEYQPKNNPVIEYESEEFYDYYIAAFFDIINGNFSDEDYGILLAIINRPIKTTFEVYVQTLKADGKWDQDDRFSIAVFKDFYDARNHAEKLHRQISENATDGEYRVRIEKLNDGEFVEIASSDAVWVNKSAAVGYVVKDTITNLESGEEDICYLGTDGYVHDFPEYATPYKVKKWAEKHIEKECSDAFCGHNERTAKNSYIEAKKWMHNLTIVEVSIKE